MENSTLGPLPAAVPAGPTSRARTEVLAALRAQPGPVTPAALAEATGLHPNTAREHLDGLVLDGLARRRRAAPQGRGRPAWRYSATTADLAEYAGLAAALAEVVARTSADPWADAVAAGTAWGRDLGRGDEVVDLLADLRFAPEPDDDGRTVRLTRCPLLETARRHPQVVCGVHLGLVRGALEAAGQDPEGTELRPFAEPGACVLALGPGPR